ncbi:AAA family ATPase [Nocardia sp. NPDC051750]|uniref:nucleotide-binding protein n=1 Tax=Nocardia sp. NPDC051750 TaxID=3364325 RepID=UPI003796C5E5
MATRTRRPSLVARIRTAGGILIAVLSTKGGVGKSLIAWMLAHELAQRGLRVLLIETDDQQTLTDIEAVRAIAPRVTVMLYPHLSIWEDIDNLRAGYDVVVVDGRGHNEAATRAVLAAVAPDPHAVVLVPVKPFPADIWAIRRDTAPLLVEAGAQFAPGGELTVRMVLTDFDPREVITAGALAALDRAGIAPQTHGLQRRTAYAQALGHGLAVCEFEPGGPAAADVAVLATETATLALGENNPKGQQ